MVYVGMGTLSILPEATLKALSAAMQRSTVARFVWVVPDNQQALLPKDLVDYSKRWSTSTANDTMPPMKAGDVLLASWVPQLAVLKHENVKAFWSHGGMNGVAEGTYARSPFLCTPLFSDQPDNCQHIQDRGMGLRLNTAEVKPSSVERALSDLLTRRAHYQAGLEVAWRANVGAGGITRAIQVIEMAASLGYEGSRAMFVPRVLQRREADGTAKSDVQYLVEKYDIDVIAGVVLAVVVFRQLFKACCGCCRCCSRCCCRRKTEQPKAKQVKTE